MREQFKILANKYHIIFSLYCKLSHLFVKTKLLGDNIFLDFDKSILTKCKINIKGYNNKVIVDEFSILKNSKISIVGNNNNIHIKSNCRIYNGNFAIENDNNIIEIGQGTTIFGLTHLDCIEGTKLIIGEDCMFSSDVSIKTGDSHSIIMENNKKRINKSKSVIIGNHVWFGTKVIILKGSQISNNSIVGAGSVVTNIFNENNIIIGGNPAKKIKSQINWIRERV